MAEVVIKGEIHSSRSDFEEERDILAEGVDTLVLEGQKEDAKYSWLHSWFGVAILIFEYLFAQFLYTDSQTLVDIAKGQGADVVYTRESDAELLTNSHRLVKALAFVSFYACLFISVIYGLVLQNHWGGALWLIGSGLVPLLMLRLHETWKSTENRDEIIAGKIAGAAENGGRVVAVMGQSHAKNMEELLPDELDPEIREPNYGVFSVQMARDMAMPVLRLTGTMSIVYPVFLLVAELWLVVV